MSDDYLLQAKEITKRFGGVVALNNVSFNISKSEIVGIIGPNGAGKTTLFNCISGVFPPDSGHILFNGVNITGLGPWQIARKGIARTFQIVRPMKHLTVLQNVMVGAYLKTKTKSEAMKIAIEKLKYVGLEHLRYKKASELNITQQKLMGLACALSIEPKLLMLDEVMAGLRPVEVNNLLSLLKKIRKEEKRSLLIIEHNMRAIMSISDRIIVLDNGEKIAEGKPIEVADDERVIKAYLGYDECEEYAQT